MTYWKSTANPHYAKPLHIRVAFRVWLTWRNSALFRASVTGLLLALPLWALLALVLLAF